MEPISQKALSALSTPRPRKATRQQFYLSVYLHTLVHPPWECTLRFSRSNGSGSVTCAALPLSTGGTFPSQEADVMNTCFVLVSNRSGVGGQRHVRFVASLAHPSELWNRARANAR